MAKQLEDHIGGRFINTNGVNGCKAGQQNNTRSITAVYTMFNRHGGVSTGNFDSLNVGLGLGDSESAVRQNRDIVKQALGISRLLSAKQVHGVSIHCCRGKYPEDMEFEGEKGYDALFTNQPGIGLMIQHADCQPVLLYDPVMNVVGAVHCGWRGSVQDILQKSVAAMVLEYGSQPEIIQAVIGPSLGPCCGEFRNFKDELPQEFYPFMVGQNYFDFWNISKYQLEMAGLVPGNIGATEVCTVCSPEYFSYRRACRLSGGITGRNCSVIALTQ